MSAAPQDNTAKAFWRPEMDEFWRAIGHSKTESQPAMNLLLLLAGASIWMIWAVLTVFLLDVGYGFSLQQLFNLIASAGLAGFCVRLCGSFIVHHCGTRGALLLSGYLLLIPILLLLKALNSLHSPWELFLYAAISSGLGAGLLTQIISASCYLFPLKMRPLVQEVPLSLGAAGLILVLVGMPLLVQSPWVAHLGFEVMSLQLPSSNISGKVNAGEPVWLGASLLLSLALLLPALWYAHSAPRVAIPSMQLLNKPLWLGVLRSCLLLGAIFILCLAWQLPDKWFTSFPSIPAVREITVVLTVAMLLFLLRTFSSHNVLVVHKQLQVLMSREANLLGLLYLMGMGSLLGFAVSFPLFIKAVFGLQQQGGVWQANPVAPAVLIYGWLPVVLGLVARAAGSWMAQRWRASLINQVALFFLLFSSLFMAYFGTQALKSLHPEQLFFDFFIWALVFFVAAGISAGSVMNMALKALPRPQQEAALVWIITLAAVGAYYIPRMYADNWNQTGPGVILIGFAVFYFIGLLINWFFYLRRSSALSLSL